MTDGVRAAAIRQAVAKLNLAIRDAEKAGLAVTLVLSPGPGRGLKRDGPLALTRVLREIK